MTTRADDHIVPPAGADGLISSEQFRRIVDRVLTLSQGQHTFIALQDTNTGTTRVANNQIVQNVNTRRLSLAVTLAFGQQHATVTVTDFGDESIDALVRRATEIARLSPVDPEYVPPLSPQDYAEIHTLQRDTAGTSPSQRIDLAIEAVNRCQAEHVTAAGIVATSLTVAGVAADSGLFAYEPRTEARFSLTAMAGNASGWAANVHRSLDRLAALERTRLAVEKAKRSANPAELPPGRYTVILEPAAVAGLVGPMAWMLDAKSFYKRTSPFAGKLGRVVIDQRLSLLNRPDHPGLLGNGFNGDGLPADARVWIENGVLKQLRYDRFTAQEHHVYPTPSLDAPVLSGMLPRTDTLGERADANATEVSGLRTDESIEALISGTERGILVSNFWYIRTVNPTDLTLTGMTRDGTFLIEDGRIVGPVVNFRWHDSPLRALTQIEAFTAPMDAVSNENWKMQLPAMRIRDFNFSSVTRF